VGNDKKVLRYNGGRTRTFVTKKRLYQTIFWREKEKEENQPPIGASYYLETNKGGSKKPPLSLGKGRRKGKEEKGSKPGLDEKKHWANVIAIWEGTVSTAAQGGGEGVASTAPRAWDVSPGRPHVKWGRLSRQGEGGGSLEDLRKLTVGAPAIRTRIRR